MGYVEDDVNVSYNHTDGFDNIIIDLNYINILEHRRC